MTPPAAAQPLSALLLWLLPALFLLHDAEEALFLPSWLRRNRDYLMRRFCGEETTAPAPDDPPRRPERTPRPKAAGSAARNTARGRISRFRRTSRFLKGSASSARNTSQGRAGISRFPARCGSRSGIPCRRAATVRTPLRHRVFRRMLPQLFSVTRKQFALMAAEELLLLLGVTVHAAATGIYRPWLALFLAFGLHLMVHLAQGVAVGRYFPALATTLPGVLYFAWGLQATVFSGRIPPRELLPCTLAGVLVAGLNLWLLHRAARLLARR